MERHESKCCNKEKHVRKTFTYQVTWFCTVKDFMRIYLHTFKTIAKFIGKIFTLITNHRKKSCKGQRKIHWY